MTGESARVDTKGGFSYPQVYNNDAGVWEKYDGHEGHSRLQTVFKVASSLATFFTVDANTKGYITFLFATPLTLAVAKTIAGTFKLERSGSLGTIFTLLIYPFSPARKTVWSANAALANQPFLQLGDGVKPFIAVAASSRLRVRAITRSARVTISFYKSALKGQK